MKKKILIALLLFSALTFTGCVNDSANINISSEKESGIKQVGLEQLKCIDNSYLYYDTITNIVYFWNGVMGGFSNLPLLHRPTTHQTDCHINIIRQQIHWKK